jgi:hypothetical protein
MIIITSVGAIDVASKINTSLDRVVVTSKTLEMLREMLSSLELGGVSEDNPGTEKIGELVENENGTWSIELDRATFQLWFGFENRYYMAYGPGEFPDPVCSDPEYADKINKVKQALELE